MSKYIAPILLSFALLLSEVQLVQADSPSGQTVSLARLLDAGAKNHPATAKHELLAESLRLSRKKLSRTYWPELSASASATWQSDVTSLDIALPGVTLAPPPKEQYRATLDLRQKIWDGGVSSKQRTLSENLIAIETEKTNLEWYQVRERILQLYFAGVIQQERREQALALEGNLERIIENVRTLLENGMVTNRDLVLVQARKLEARQAIADAEAQILSAKKSIEDLTGVAISANERLYAPGRHCAPTTARATAEGLQRPDLALLAAQEQVLHAKNDMERVSDRPKVVAFATGGFGRPGLNFLEDNPSAYFIGGVSLQVPLTYLYTGKRDTARQQLAIQKSLIARQHDSLTLQIRTQIDSQESDLTRLQVAIAHDSELLSLRVRAREQTELQLSLGTATMTDLVSDLSEEDVARARGVIHKVQRDLACHKLAHIKGTL